ncbi:MAG: NYN domain-containing protein [Endomicrobiales bacterium]
MLHYILDGYNIIRSDASGTLGRGTLEQQRGRLVDLIQRQRPQGSPNNRVSVVFDGPAVLPFIAGGSSSCRVGGTEVIFSEGVTADAVIEQMVNGSSRPAEIVVVTDDKGLRRLIGVSGAKMMGTGEFTARLLRKGAGGGPSGEAGEDESFGETEVNEELKKKWLK